MIVQQILVLLLNSSEFNDSFFFLPATIQVKPLCESRSENEQRKETSPNKET